jgi:hypothetical protein
MYEACMHSNACAQVRALRVSGRELGWLGPAKMPSAGAAAGGSNGSAWHSKPSPTLARRKSQTRRGSDVTPPWPVVNADIMCPHGQLSVVRNRRRVISARAWKLLRRFFTGGPQFRAPKVDPSAAAAAAASSSAAASSAASAGAAASAEGAPVSSSPLSSSPSAASQFLGGAPPPPQLRRGGRRVLPPSLLLPHVGVVVAVAVVAVAGQLRGRVPAVPRGARAAAAG